MMAKNQLAKYEFEVGKSYSYTEASTPEDYLETALSAERYIAKYRKNDESGTYWSSPSPIELPIPSSQTVNLTLYGGVAGISYLYKKLYSVTGREQYREAAAESIRYLENHWRELIPSKLTGYEGFSAGAYAGLGGLGFVLAEWVQDTQDGNADGALRGIVRWYEDNAIIHGDKAYWTGSNAILLDGGVILLLLKYRELHPEDEVVRVLLDRAGRWFVATGEKGGKGGLAFNGFSGIENYSAPNFELGTAGAGLVLGKLYESTHDDGYLQAALQAAQYLESLKVPQTRGSLIPYRILSDGTSLRDDQGKTIFYLGTCHGPAGTSRFYYELYKITKDRKWLAEIEDLIDGLESLGAPEHQSSGLWNTECYCCAHAGILQFFVALYEDEGSARWLELARRTAGVLLGQAESVGDGTADWPLAFTRIEPEIISRDIGYYNGAAGIASSLLQLYLAETNQFKWCRLPDDSF